MFCNIYKFCIAINIHCSFEHATKTDLCTLKSVIYLQHYNFLYPSSKWYAVVQIAKVGKFDMNRRPIFTIYVTWSDKTMNWKMPVLNNCLVCWNSPIVETTYTCQIFTPGIKQPSSLSLLLGVIDYIRLAQTRMRVMGARVGKDNCCKKGV